jgi:hypothetical protein
LPKKPKVTVSTNPRTGVVQLPVKKGKLFIAMTTRVAALHPYVRGKLVEFAEDWGNNHKNDKDPITLTIGHESVESPDMEP